MTKKKKPNQFKLENRKTLQELQADPVLKQRKEKFGGPTYNNIKYPDDDLHTKSFSISHAPRFTWQNLNDSSSASSGGGGERNISSALAKKRKLDESTAKKLQEMSKSYGEAKTIEQLYKPVEKNIKTANFSLSHEARFEWEKEDKLMELRSKHALKTGQSLEKIIGTGGKETDSAAVERGYNVTHDRCVVPVIRQDTETNNNNLRGSSNKNNNEQDKKLLEEQLESKKLAERYNTIGDFVQHSKTGDFSRGSERKFQVSNLQQHSPAALKYVPNYDAIEPHKSYPVIGSASEQSKNVEFAEKKRKQEQEELAKRQQQIDLDYGDGQTQATRAMRQFDKVAVTRSPTALIDLRSPISANMPFQFDSSNYCNSRSMRAMLCDTEGMKFNCEAMKRNDFAGTSSASSAKKSKKPVRDANAKTPEHDADNKNESDTNNKDDSASSKKSAQKKDRHQLPSSVSSSAQLFYLTGIQSPFSSPSQQQHHPDYQNQLYQHQQQQQNPTKISITSPSLGGFCHIKEKVRQIQAAAATTTTSMTIRPQNSTSAAAESAQRSLEHDFFEIGDDDNEQQQHYHQTTSTTPSPYSSKNNNINQTTSSTPNPTKWSGSRKLAEYKTSGIPLAALLRKKRLEKLSVFTSLYSKLGGNSLDRLDKLEEQVFLEDHH